MNVPKAVILAGRCGGPGPWPLLGPGARQLTPVANRPILFHHLDALAAAGVREAVVLTDDATGASIRAALGDGSTWRMQLAYVQQEDALDVLASAAVAEFIDGAPALVHHGDVLLSEPLAALGDDFVDSALDAMILRSAHPAGRPAPTSAGYILGPGVQAPLRRRRAGIDELLDALLAEGARIGVREVDACLPCRGGSDALLEANRRMLEQLAGDPGGERIFDSKLQGPVRVHPSAEVRSSVLRGPVVVGAGARIVDSYVGAYTSVGAGAQLDSVEIEHSMVLDGAEVKWFGSRLEDSVIGPGARVIRDFRMPRALRLTVGSGAEVAFP